MSRLRICAVLRARPARLPAGPSGGEVRLLECGPLVVAVEVDPSEVPVSTEALATHDRVVRFLADQVDAVLPARFGWIADEASLEVRLAPHRQSLLDALELTAGREQMNLRLYGPPKHPETLAPGGEADSKPGTHYLESKREQARRRHEALELDPLRMALSGLVRAERVQRGAEGARGAEPTRLASVYHLVDRGRAADYREIVVDLGGRLLPLRATVSGPWPPYAYAPEGLA